MRTPKEGLSDNPNDSIVRSTLELSGVMPHMLRRNPPLGSVLSKFFTSEVPVLVVGGESGMGKSLFASDIRRLDPIVQARLPQSIRSRMTVITWDRVHKALFSMASHPYGDEIPLPKGETYLRGRRLASYVLSDAVRHTRRLHPGGRILVESPLFGSRGETMFGELSDMASQIQVVIMHSPQTRDKVLQQGSRLMETSGQGEAMREMRANLYREMTGRSSKGTSEAGQDDLIKKGWEQRFAGSLIVDWSPDDDPAGYEATKTAFVDFGIRTENVSPANIGNFIAKKYQIILDSLPNKSGFIRKLDPRNKV